MKSLITDTRLRAIKVESDKRDRAEHNHAVAVIVAGLRFKTNRINYDHIKTTLPKAPEIPLESPSGKKKKRADIAFILPTGTLVHVYVTIFPKGSYPMAINTKKAQNITTEG